MSIYFTNDPELPLNHLRIKVGTTKFRLWEHYGWVSEVWTKRSSGILLHESLEGITPTVGEKIFFLKKFGRKTTSKSALKWAGENGYRVAFPNEREAFVEIYSGLRLFFDTVDLGSYSMKDGKRHVPVLTVGNAPGQYLGSTCIEEWTSDYHSLFIKA